MGTQLHEHSKCQMEQLSKLTEAVTQMISSYNANNFAARGSANPENSNNADSGEDDEENDRQNRVTIHETDGSLYNETDLAASFLSHQETSSSSVATTGRPEDDPMMGSVFKEFSESYNQANENWGEPASEEVTKVVPVAFKEYRYKLQEVQRNMLTMTGCFIKLLSQLPNILKTNGDHKDEKLEAIQTILDGIKMPGHATQNLVSIRKNSLLSRLGSVYKDLAKFAEDTDSYLFGEESEDFLKKAKGRH